MWVLLDTDFLLLFFLLLFVLVGVESLSRFQCSCSFSLSFSCFTCWFVCGPQSRKMDGQMSLHLRCIVVKATQIFQSSLVAELVLILCDRKGFVKTERCYFLLFLAHLISLSHRYHDNCIVERVSLNSDYIKRCYKNVLVFEHALSAFTPNLDKH